MKQDATIIPTLRYRDATKAVVWLCEAFGFERHLVNETDDTGVVYAQLVLTGEAGHGMIMVSPAREGHEFDRYQGPAADKATQSAYVVVKDARSHCERAVSTGAEVVQPPSDEHGGWMYSCRDFEGHLWNFGEFDPWRVPGTETTG